MAAHLRSRIPTLPGRFLKGAACMYSNTPPDEHFVLARHPPDHPQVTVACGFSGHGFKFVPVIGEIVADLAIDGSTEHPHRPFRPAPRARPRRPEVITMTTTSLPPEPDRDAVGEYYTDPEVFALEQERVFETMWFCVARGLGPGQAGPVPHRPGGP